MENGEILIKQEDKITSSNKDLDLIFKFVYENQNIEKNTDFKNWKSKKKKNIEKILYYTNVIRIKYAFIKEKVILKIMHKDVLNVIIIFVAFVLRL